MKIQLINLDRDTDRLHHIEKQFKDFALPPFERIPAIYGHNLSPSIKSQFTNPRFTNWHPGQIGCFLSHKQAWTNLLESKSQYSLVLEDDILISKQLAKINDEILNSIENKFILRLDPPSARVKAQHISSIAGRSVIELMSDSWCTGAYILDRACAEYLLSVDPKDYMPSDHFLYSFSSSVVPHNIRILQISPALASQERYENDTSQFTSNINESENVASRESIGALQTLKKKCKAALEVLRMKKKVVFHP